MLLRLVVTLIYNQIIQRFPILVTTISTEELKLEGSLEKMVIGAIFVVKL